jgi:hypothetical protein
MRLITSTRELVMGGHPYPDFPILLWDTMESCAPANQFLRYYLLRGAIGSKKSWAGTGRALYDYFSFLQAHELSWDDVDRGEEKTLLAAYRDYSFEVAKLARSTVRNRLLYICEFYSFAQRQAWIKALPALLALVSVSAAADKPHFLRENNGILRGIIGNDDRLGTSADPDTLMAKKCRGVGVIECSNSERTDTASVAVRNYIIVTAAHTLFYDDVTPLGPIRA